MADRAERGPEVVDVGIGGLFLDEDADRAVVLLGDLVCSSRVLPMVIGPAEARSIAIGLSPIEPQRPLAHDLVLRTVAAMGARIVRFDIVALERGAFHGEIEIAASGHHLRIDSRPSDGLAVALRAGVPIGVDQALFDRSSVEVSRDGENDGFVGCHEELIADFVAFLEEVGPSDFSSDIPGTDDGDDGDDGDAIGGG